MKNLLLVTALLAPLAASAQNLLLNGSFENATAFANWTVAGGGVYPPALGTYGTNFAFGEVIPTDSIVGGSPDAAGTKGVYLVDDVATQTISQSFSLGVGSFRAGFDYYIPANGALNTNNSFLTTTITGPSGTVFTSTLGLGSPVTTWTNVASTFAVGIAGTYTYTFTFTPGGVQARDVVLDRAFVTAVPEPETYGLMLAGLAVVSFVARRRSANR
jgi:hypothetical protein